MYRPYSSSLADSRPFLDVQSLIHNLAQDFVTNFNTGNYDKAAALFAQDGAFMAPHYDPAYGPKAVERILRLFSESGYEDLPPRNRPCRSFRRPRYGDRPLHRRYPPARRHHPRRPREVRESLAPPGHVADRGRLLEHQSSAEPLTF